MEKPSMKDNMVMSMPITELRKEIMHLPELLNKSEQVTVTNRGQPVATIVSFTFIAKLREELEEMRQEMQAMQETIEILQDAELMESIREGMKALQNGDTVSLEEARHALGLE
jgi:PHD/YefM family antitoxin component YafN of YafNO toxin-antitoxin module